MNTSIYHRIGHEWCDHLKGLMWGQEDAHPLRTAKVLHVREVILIELNSREIQYYFFKHLNNILIYFINQFISCQKKAFDRGCKPLNKLMSDKIKPRV